MTIVFKAHAKCLKRNFPFAAAVSTTAKCAVLAHQDHPSKWHRQFPVLSVSCQPSSHSLHAQLQRTPLVDAYESAGFWNVERIVEILPHLPNRTPSSNVCNQTITARFYNNSEHIVSYCTNGECLIGRMVQQQRQQPRLTCCTPSGWLSDQYQIVLEHDDHD